VGVAVATPGRCELTQPGVEQIWSFPKIKVPQIGCFFFFVEKPIKMDDLVKPIKMDRYPNSWMVFLVEKPNLKLMITRGTPILGNHHLANLVPIHARYLQVFTKKIAGLVSFSKVFHVVKRHKQLPFT